jgi:hypothetical protein
LRSAGSGLEVPEGEPLGPDECVNDRHSVVNRRVPRNIDGSSQGTCDKRPAHRVDIGSRDIGSMEPDSRHAICPTATAAWHRYVHLPDRARQFYAMPRHR